MAKLYDIYFRPYCAACMVVEANSIEEAKGIAEDILCDMNREELMRRIEGAVDFMGVRIDCVEEIEEE